MTSNPFTRIHVRTHRFALDEHLAEGADPESTAALGLRSMQLLRGRAGLASALERAAESARNPGPAFSARVPVRRAEVIDCAEDIEALAERLREPGPTSVRGIAMVSQLLHDGASPLYTDRGASLRYALRSARLALDPLSDEAFVEVPIAA
jgi:hypothetical protein